MFTPWSVHFVSVDEDQHASEDLGTLVGDDTKDGYTTKKEPLHSESSYTEPKHAT